MNKKLKILNQNINLRVVIKFQLISFKVWIHEDEGNSGPELDEGKREKEFQFKSDKLDMLPFTAFDSGFKEGKVGFFCTECNGLKISNIQLWVDDCSIVQKDTGYSNLVSPCSVKYIEK